ncbi:hypothetical protein HU200_037492 [Digitaria exilis]|uniref:Uncharacterized protein n=1 Tax=Digitaria exilis TaxID=1010633 RepID=A0A835BF32_9POAL|nr:hypothetical protein HU200_037492 [Digitaria exilis]
MGVVQAERPRHSRNRLNSRRSVRAYGLRRHGPGHSYHEREVKPSQRIHLYTPYRRHALAPLSPSLSAPASHQGLSTGGDEMVQRLTYRKRHSYATKSNQTRVVKTPGPDPLLVLSFLPFSFHFWWSHRSASDVVLMCSIGLLFVLAGGKLVYQYTKKRASGPKCPVTGKKIQGVSGSFAQHTVGRSTACVIL